MAFDWWDYLDVADEWMRELTVKAASKVSYRDAKLRAVVSRAYYAALMSTSEHLTRAHGFKRPAHASHHEIKLELERREKSAPQYKLLLSKIANLQSVRTIADYDAALPAGFNLDSIADAALDDAMDARSALRQLSK